jgi:hypothetical protein
MGGTAIKAFSLMSHSRNFSYFNPARKERAAVATTPTQLIAVNINDQFFFIFQSPFN